MEGERVTFLQSAIWNPQDFILLLLHDGHDLSANVGDAAGLDHTCNTERGEAGRGRVTDFQHTRRDLVQGVTRPLAYNPVTSSSGVCIENR